MDEVTNYLAESTIDAVIQGTSLIAIEQRLRRQFHRPH